MATLVGRGYGLEVFWRWEEIHIFLILYFITCRDDNFSAILVVLFA